MKIDRVSVSRLPLLSALCTFGPFSIEPVLPSRPSDLPVQPCDRHDRPRVARVHCPDRVFLRATTLRTHACIEAFARARLYDSNTRRRPVDRVRAGSCIATREPITRRLLTLPSSIGTRFTRSPFNPIRTIPRTILVQ